MLFAGLLIADLPSGSSENAADSLQAATVTADKGVVVSRKDTLSTVSHFSVSETLQCSPALHVGDNGGFAGLKTVSLRGLGSAHTAVYIDGVRVGNVQSGQSDLGMLGTDMFSFAVVDYAQNSISFNTVRPSFDRMPVGGSVRMTMGSFGTYLPSARLDFRLSENMSLSANAAYVSSKGDYVYGNGLRRANNDIRQVRAGVDLFGELNEGDYHVKAYYNDARRGTPGSVQWPSDDRQEDMNIFIQGVLHNRFSSSYSLDMSVKAAYDEIFYSSSWGDSRYGQSEYQFNSSHVFRVAPWCRLSLAADIQWDALKSDNYDAARLTAFSALASSFRTSRFSADVALEYTGSFDRDALSRNVFSPSADIRYVLFKGLDIRGFARRAYRVPVFNELYYVGYGNPELRPEDAWLTDIGVEFHRAVADSWTVNAGLDGFFNVLNDKIVSAPSEEDPNIWRPYNIAKVHSAGFDASVGFVFSSGEWTCSSDLKYTFQDARDVTPGIDSYGSHVPYVSKHSIVFNGSVGWRGWRMSPLWQFRGGRSDGYGSMPDWNTLDVSLARSIGFRRAGNLILKVAVKNVFDNRYETVSGYPMPGRSIIGGMEFKF